MKEKGFTPIIFILLIFLISGVIIGGSLYVKNNYPSLLNSQKEASSPSILDNKNIQQSSDITPTIKNELTWKKLVSEVCKYSSYSASTSKLIPTVTGEMTNWKIYTNGLENYYFRYPTEWEQKTCDAQRPNILLIGPGLKDNPNSLPVASFVFTTDANLDPGFTVLNKKTVNIDGKQSAYVVAKDNKKIFSTDQLIIVLIPLSSSRYLVAELYDLSYLTYFEKILSTITFVPISTITITSSSTLKISSIEEQPITLEQGTLNSTNTKYNFTKFDINITLEIPEEGEYIASANLDKIINLRVIIDDIDLYGGSYKYNKGPQKITLQYEDRSCESAPSDNSARPMPLEITLLKYSKDGHVLPFNQQIKYYLDKVYYTKPHKLSELRKHC